MLKFLLNCPVFYSGIVIHGVLRAIFGADLNNDHIQPGEGYQRHGGPSTVYDDNPVTDVSSVVGFAADEAPV